MSGGGAETGATGLQAVMGAGRGGCVEDVEGGSGGGTDGGGGGYGRDGNKDRRLIRCEYTVANVILETDPNSLYAYEPVLELHHPIMSMIGGRGGWLERERERESDRYRVIRNKI